MASSRGILNIQSLNELTSENHTHICDLDQLNLDSKIWSQICESLVSARG